MGRGPRLAQGPTVILSASILSLSGGCGDSGGRPPEAPDSRLASLAVAEVELQPVFDPETLSYEATASFFTHQITITATPVDSQASIAIDGAAVPAGDASSRRLQGGGNDIAIRVVNKTALRDYAVAVERSVLAEQGVLSAAAPRHNDVLGTAMAAHGDTLVAGTPFESGDARGVNSVPANFTLTDSGAAYAYRREAGGAWVQEAYLKAANADAGDGFGHSLAVFGDTAVVGAPRESSAATGIDGDSGDNSAPSAGAAYVFVRSADGNWTQQAYLKASDSAAFDEFGYTVSFDGETIAVSSRRRSVGTIYLFTREAGGTWSEEARVQGADGIADVAFGDALAIDGDRLAVGAKWHGSSSEGAVYLFRRTEPGAWIQEDMVGAINADPDDNLGGSVALVGDTLAAGALREASAAIGGDGSDNSAPESGAVYVFDRRGSGDWVQTAMIKASNSEAGDSFGYAVDLRRDWLAVAADNEASGVSGAESDPGDNSLPGSGAIYIYARDAAGDWSQELYLKAGTPRGNVRLGRQLAFTENGIAASAPFEDGVDGSTTDSGIVHVFE